MKKLKGWKEPMLFARDVQVCNEVGTEVTRLIMKKRERYGRNLRLTSQFLEILFPEGIPVTAYRYMGVVVRILDKLVRWANNMRSEAAGHTVMDDESPFADIAGYGLATMVDDRLEIEERDGDELTRKLREAMQGGSVTQPVE